MHVAGIIIGCMLLGQATDSMLPPLSDPVRKAPADLQSIAPLETATQPDTVVRRRPPELVDEAIHLPEGSTLKGRPLTLIDALGSTFDRRRQHEIVQAYWRLVEAAAEYRFALEYVGQLESTDAGLKATLRSPRASAAALCREAELRATEAQFELAILALMPADAPLPLPTDPPHVGAYRTYFNELFANRTPPDAARLTDKLLPLQRRAIDQSAAAVLAAEDAFTAVSDDLRAGRGSTASPVAAGRELLLRRQSFIRLVCEYNRTIAEYSLTVASPSTSPRQLVAMLIGPPRQAGLPRSADNRGSVSAPVTNQPTLAPPRAKNEPTPAAPRDGFVPTNRLRNQPTLAPPRAKNEPTPAAPRDGFVPTNRLRNQPTLAPPRETIERLGYDEPAKQTPPEQPRREAPEQHDAKLVPVNPPLEFSPTRRTVRKPFDAAAVTRGDGVDATSATPLYSALRDTAPAVRAKQLTTAIHWDRYLPEDAGKPIGLKECLLRNPGGDRLGTIAAYWMLRRWAAQYHILSERAEFLDALAPTVLQRRNDPTGAADMLRLNAAQLAARADLGSARAKLVEAQFNLAMRIGAIEEPQWPLASTVPHSGEYSLKLDAQSQSLTGTWAVRRLAAVIPFRCESVWQSAAAVVEADAARVEAAEKYRNGSTAIDQVLETVAGQTEQTSAFLDSLAEYNRSIAEYALTVLASSTPADKLVSAMVVEP